MPNLKTNVNLHVLLFAAFEVQFEVLDGRPQSQQKPYVLLFAVFEVQFEVLDGRPRRERESERATERERESVRERCSNLNRDQSFNLRKW